MFFHAHIKHNKMPAYAVVLDKVPGLSVRGKSET